MVNGQWAMVNGKQGSGMPFALDMGYWVSKISMRTSTCVMMFYPGFRGKKNRKSGVEKQPYHSSGGWRRH
jgi:hypothetical protein